MPYSPINGIDCPDRIAILNYQTAEVTICYIPDGIKDSEDVESWMWDEGYPVSDCHYMVGDITVNDTNVITLKKESKDE